MYTTIRKVVPVFALATVWFCCSPGTWAQVTDPAPGNGLSINDLQFGTNPSNSPLADFLSGIPGNNANEVSVGIALENLCGQLISETTPLVPQIFNIFDVCFGVFGPVLAALDPEDTEFAQFVEESAGLLLGASGQEVAAMANSFTQLTPAGAGASQERLNKLRLAQVDSSAEVLAFDAHTGNLTMDLDSGGGAGDLFNEGWRFYISGDASTGEKDATELVTGYDLDGLGLNAGGDYRLDPKRYVGFNASIRELDLDYLNNSTAEVTTVDLAGYGLWFKDDSWYIQSHAGFGTSDIDMARQLQFTSRSTVIVLPDGTTFFDPDSPREEIVSTFASDTDASRLFASVVAGRDFHRGPVTIGVSGMLDYLDVSVDGYTEASDNFGGIPLQLEIDDYDHQSLRFIAGVDVSRSISTSYGVVTPFVRGEWIHEFKDEPTEITARFTGDPFSVGFEQNNLFYSGGVPAVDPATGDPDPTTFTITSDDPDTNYFQFTTGASTVFKGGMQAFVSLDALVGLRDFERYVFRIGVTKEL